MWVILVCVICIIWVVLTIIAQFDYTFSRKILNIDRLGLIPRWTFFAPTPGDTDVHLLVRFGKEKDLSPWSETLLTINLQKRHKLFRGLFNPYRRIEKLLFDFSNDVSLLTKKPYQIRHLTDYILILRFVEILAKEHDADRVQFMLAGSNLTLLENLKLLIISDTHLLIDA